jgi:hypothetical protein
MGLRPFAIHTEVYQKRYKKTSAGLRGSAPPPHSFCPDIPTTLRQRSVSVASMTANSVALPAIGMAPSSATRCFMAGSARAALVSWLRRSTILLRRGAPAAQRQPSSIGRKKISLCSCILAASRRNLKHSSFSADAS